MAFSLRRALTTTATIGALLPAVTACSGDSSAGRAPARYRRVGVRPGLHTGLGLREPDRIRQEH